MSAITEVIAVFLQVLIFAIFARAIISWFPVDPQGPIVQALNAVTEPIMVPLRKVVPRIGMIDITPLVAILLLSFISSALATT